MNDDFLWVEKYRPKTVEQTILQKQLKDTFTKIVESLKYQICYSLTGIQKDNCSKSNMRTTST